MAKRIIGVLLGICFVFVAVPAMAQTMAQKETEVSRIDQEYNFLTSLLTQVQNRRSLLVLWAQKLKKDIQRLKQQEASKQRAFETHQKAQAEKKAPVIKKE